MTVVMRDIPSRGVQLKETVRVGLSVIPAQTLLDRVWLVVLVPLCPPMEATLPDWVLDVAAT
jgi:hypothetical protein